MGDSMAETAQKNTRKSIPSMVVSVIIFLFFVALFSSLVVYLQVRHLALQQDLNDFNESLADAIYLSPNTNSVNSKLGIQVLRSRLLAKESVIKIALHTIDNKLIWSSAKDLVLDKNDQIKLLELVKEKKTNSWVWDESKQFMLSPSFHSLINIFIPESSHLATLSVVASADGVPVVVIKTLRDYSDTRVMAKQVGLVCFLIVCLTALLLGLVFSRVFRKSLNVIKSDEEILNNQVAKLSMLLDENKELQQNMRSASSRAVELNERFLRRVGSDLHDGPAQSIGYALLRLNQVSPKKISEELGYEFHAVIEALNESLDEIRGISSGLVLPELEKMTLEEAIHKIIQRHKSNTKTEVKELYLNLPVDMALPIKICAYRFVQEGLNNAYKHGAAKKCRFTAKMVDDVLHLSLKDNGMGFRKSVLDSDDGHLGLVGLKDRIESLGGKLYINSELGVGTSLKVSVRMPRTEK